MQNKKIKGKIITVDSMFMEFTSSEKILSRQIIYINRNVLSLVEEVRFVNSRKYMYKVFYDASKEDFKPGDSIELKLGDMSIKLDTSKFGSVIGVDGKVIDKYLGDPIKKDVEVFKQKSSLFGDKHLLSERRNVKKSLNTGIVTVDVFNPISKGQKIAIVGTAKTGKSHLAASMFINPSKDNNTFLIYAFIGSTFETVSQVRGILAANKSLKKSLIIHANPASKIEQYLTPFLAMTYAESLRKTGKDVVVVMDNLTTHAQIYSEMSILADKPVGRDVMPADMFYIHSSLLERSGNFENNASITVFPIVHVNKKDFSSVVASNIISITDGQMLLDSKKASAREFPAIDLGQSVSRIGFKTASKAFVKSASKISKFYYEFLSVKSLYGSILTSPNDRVLSVLKKGRGLENLMSFTLKNKNIFSENLEIFFLKFIEWGWEELFSKTENILISAFIWLTIYDKEIKKQIKLASKGKVNWPPLKKYLENCFISIAKEEKERTKIEIMNWFDRPKNKYSFTLTKEKLNLLFDWLEKNQDQSTKGWKYEI